MKGVVVDRVFWARFALSTLCTIQGVATVSIDLNRTHATNPAWPGHARFHLVWQTSTVVLLAGVELVLIASGRGAGFYLASVLAALSPLGFIATYFSRRLFGGTLSDPNGIPPARITAFGVARSFDMNLVAVVVALISLVAIDFLYA